MMNKSFADSSRTSPGIMSPADNFTTSPGTRSLSGISLGLAVADDGGGDLDHRLEFGGGVVGLGFLDEPQRDAQHHHRHHHPAADHVAGALRRGEGHDGENRQQNHQRIAHGHPEPPQPVVLFSWPTSFGP